jgi:hypothetical protein
MIIGTYKDRIIEQVSKGLLKYSAQTRPTLLSKISAMNAFEESLRKDGHMIFEVKHPTNFPECPWILDWAIPSKSNAYYWDFRSQMWSTQEQRGGSVLVFERGYVNAEEHRRERPTNPHYSLGFNGLHGRAKFVREDMPPDRWDKLGVELKPWKNDGKYILCCGQNPAGANAQHFANGGNDMLLSIGVAAQQFLSKLAVYRPHPSSKKHVENFPLSPHYEGNLRSDLEDCALLISVNSIALVDATVAGVPTLNLDAGSMVWGLTNYEPEDIKNEVGKFSREAWKNNLAYSQWTEKELLSGEALEHLKMVYDSGIALNYKDYIPSNINLDQTPSD